MAKRRERPVGRVTLGVVSAGLALALLLWVVASPRSDAEADAARRPSEAGGSALEASQAVRTAHDTRPSAPLEPDSARTSDEVSEPEAIPAVDSQSEAIRVVVTDAISETLLNPTAVYLQTERAQGGARALSSGRIFPEVVEGVFEVDPEEFDANASVWLVVSVTGYAPHERLQLKRQGQPAALRTYFLPLTPE